MRHLSASGFLLPALVAGLLVFLCNAPLLAGNVTDPRIAIGGGTADAAPFTGSVEFYVTDPGGTSGLYGSTGIPGSEDCYEGTPGSGTLVPGCVFFNDTANYITDVNVVVPGGLGEDFSCSTAFADAVGLPFDACSVSGNTITFYTVNNSGPGVPATLADTGLYPTYTVGGTTIQGESFVISVGAASAAGPGWPLNTPMWVSSPEPPTALLLLGGLLLLGLAGWSTTRRRWQPKS